VSPRRDIAIRNLSAKHNHVCGAIWAESSARRGRGSHDVHAGGPGLGLVQAVRTAGQTGSRGAALSHCVAVTPMTSLGPVGAGGINLMWSRPKATGWRARHPAERNRRPLIPCRQGRARAELWDGARSGIAPRTCLVLKRVGAGASCCTGRVEVAASIATDVGGGWQAPGTRRWVRRRNWVRSPWRDAGAQAVPWRDPAGSQFVMGRDIVETAVHDEPAGRPGQRDGPGA
jgi:hypothetical protein